jgi:hypothetical protein
MPTIEAPASSIGDKRGALPKIKAGKIVRSRGSAHARGRARSRAVPACSRT